MLHIYSIYIYPLTYQNHIQYFNKFCFVNNGRSAEFFSLSSLDGFTSSLADDVSTILRLTLLVL